MSFASPVYLFLLVVVVMAAVAAQVVERRRARALARFTNPELLPWITPGLPAWRRVATVVGVVLTLAAIVLASARPARSVAVPVKVATVIVALDTSRSMISKDVPPDRLTAARDVAETFVAELPSFVRVGLVVFSTTAALEAAPSEPRRNVLAAIERARASEDTAIGEAIFKSLDALAADAHETPVTDHGTTKYPNLPFTSIVVMSDGDTTTGRPNDQAVTAAKGAGVHISTIAFGTNKGTIPDHIPVPPNESALHKIADDSGGHFFRAASKPDLQAAFDDVGFFVAHREVQRDVTQWFVVAAVALGLLTALVAVTWFRRIP